MNNKNLVDYEYCRLLENILESGRTKKNRTGVDTIGIFGEQAKFSVDMDAFPILTTKKIWFKGIVHELLWFLRGDTNIKYLVDNDVHIWDEWGCKRWMEKTGVKGHISAMLPIYVKKIKEDANFAKEWGELGEGTYGGMWRAFPYYYEEHDISDHRISLLTGHVDQLKKIINTLKTNPDDRRMIVSAWHPYWVDHCALPPCHCLFHFNTEELTLEERSNIFAERDWDHQNYCRENLTHEILDKHNVPKRKLNLLLYQRSCDTFLGVPFNITSYSLLLAMVAHCVGMEPGEFIHTYGDLHIYKNHIDQVKEQLERNPMKLPKLWLNPDKKDLFSFTYDDIKLIDYKSHSAIKAPIAV